MKDSLQDGYDFHDLVAVVVDNFYGDLTSLRFRELSRDS